MSKVRLLATMACMALLLVVFTACSDSSTTNESSGSQGQENTATNDGENTPEYAVSDSLVEMDIHYHEGDIRIFKDDWPVFQKAQELTNVKLHGTAPPSATNSDEVFNMMMASGELPDIIQGVKLNMNRAAMDGALEPLDELIAEHAPNIQKYLDENPWVRAGSIASDGNLYYIPYVMEGKHSFGWFVRQDWLDKLGLEQPKTVDEYYEVLKAFREQDPNGNGQKDEVPYFSRHPESGIDYLVSLFGSRPLWHVLDGEVVFGKYLPEYKEAMVNISKWYAEGLIDKEIYTRGPNAREILFGNNTGGAVHDWFPSAASYNDSIDVPDFSFVPIAPPADKNGVVRQIWSRELLRVDGWGIASTSEHKVEAIKYFDFWFTEEGRRLMNFGIEGEQYDMVDGKPIFKESILNSDTPVNQQLWDIGAQLSSGYQMDLFYEEQWTNPIAMEGIKEYIDNDYFAEQFPPVTFTPEEEKIVVQKWGAIETFMAETQQRWIMGAEPVEENFDSYIQRLTDMGMEEVLDIYQAAYDRYQESVN